MKKILAFAVLMMLAGVPSQVLAFGNPCSLLGDHALMFAKWRNGGVPYNQVKEYFKDQGNSRIIRMERAIADDIYKKPANTLPPGTWQALALKLCRQQYGR